MKTPREVGGNTTRGTFKNQVTGAHKQLGDQLGVKHGLTVSSTDRECLVVLACERCGGEGEIEEGEEDCLK
jgi:hypothetical protein